MTSDLSIHSTVPPPRIADLLAAVRSLELVCQPELIPFYRRWAFSDQVGASTLMRRSTDTRLISC
ncbi:hypothetical protein ACIA58_15275 [Kribbella sp. NPDC051586]|uniref:hypothetical protein n=1 Tax=Kribbella sp. NPDC051586 TaxID=3364118 RepID=UPI0037A95547